MCRCAAAIARAVVTFLNAVLVGCFLSCFRSRPGPVPGPNSPRDLLVAKDQPGELLSVSDDENEKSGFEGSRGSREDLADGGGIDEQLRQEADYLKLCGAISETPVELQNVSSQINLGNTNECDDMPTNALAIDGTSTSETNSSESFKCEEDNEHLARVQSADSVPRSAFKEKSPFCIIKNRLSDFSDSPFPTPLVLRDDMQTPGTSYTSHKRSSMSRKRVWTRKQFVYPVLRSIENKLQLLELTEDSSSMLPSNTLKWRNLGSDSIKTLQQTSSNSVAKAGSCKSLPFYFPNDNASYQEQETLSLEESKCQINSPNLLDGGELSKSNSDEKHATLSLTHWLRLSSADCEQGDVNSSTSDQLHDENTIFRDNSVFTTSGMNWDVENPTPRLPKPWNGNGIPNTTTKYKENQKVSWHTTPFEERLLKVLSDDKPNPPRELITGNLFHAEET